MMPYDYSDAPPPREFELIPHGTIATVVMHIRAGGVGEDGMLTRSKEGTCEMLALEFTVVDGPYARRKFWEYLILEGTTDGHAEAAKISRGVLRTIIESARGIKPDDMSPQAREGRTLSLPRLDGLTFIAKIGIEKGGAKNDGSGGNWSDKNILLAAITPDRKEWYPVEQPPPFNGGGSSGAKAAPPGAAPPSAAPPIERPKWASS
jgi:hypothetical protein